eukprot:Hpha_TRINITY_DN13444_c0_g1::TRINITY_DN13444_c0_g1_i1::g.130837::m.130837
MLPFIRLLKSNMRHFIYDSPPPRYLPTVTTRLFLTQAPPAGGEELGPLDPLLPPLTGRLSYLDPSPFVKLPPLEADPEYPAAPYAAPSPVTRVPRVHRNPIRAQSVGGGMRDEWM